MTFYSVPGRRVVHASRDCPNLDEANEVRAVPGRRVRSRKPCRRCFPSEEDWQRVREETERYAIGLFSRLREESQ